MLRDEPADLAGNHRRLRRIWRGIPWSVGLGPAPIRSDPTVPPGGMSSYWDRWTEDLVGGPSAAAEFDGHDGFDRLLRAIDDLGPSEPTPGTAFPQD